MALYQGLICIRMHNYLGPSEVAFIEGWPHLRGGLYEGFHCMCTFTIGVNVSVNVFHICMYVNP